MSGVKNKTPVKRKKDLIMDKIIVNGTTINVTNVRIAEVGAAMSGVRPNQIKRERQNALARGDSDPLKKLKSITFDSPMRVEAGARCTHCRDEVPVGTIEVRNCSSKGTTFVVTGNYIG